MLSVIIAVSGRNDRKLDNFVEVAAAIQKQDYADCEVIIVEQVIEEPIYAEVVKQVLPTCRYTQVKHPVFNLQWLFNIGARESSGGLLFFTGADTVFGSDYFGRIVSEFTQPYILAWDKIFMLSEVGRATYSVTRDYRDTWPEWSYNRIKSPSFDYGSSGFAVFDRSFFFSRVAGFNEAFSLWGGGDNEMMLRVRDITQCAENNIRYTLLHLPHPGRKVNERRWDMLEVVREDIAGMSAMLSSADLGNKAGPNAALADWFAERVGGLVE